MQEYARCTEAKLSLKVWHKTLAFVAIKPDD